jgi:hypothetical protein
MPDSDDVERYLDRVCEIVRDDAEKQYVVPGYKGGTVDIPYSYLRTSQGRCDQLARLVRNDVPHDYILAFIDAATADGRWRDALAADGGIDGVGG